MINGLFGLDEDKEEDEDRHSRGGDHAITAAASAASASGPRSRHYDQLLVRNFFQLEKKDEEDAMV